MTLSLVAVWMSRINFFKKICFVRILSTCIKNYDLFTERIINDLDPSKDVINVDLNLASGYNLEELQLNSSKNWQSEACVCMCVCVYVCVYMCVCVCVCGPTLLDKSHEYLRTASALNLVKIVAVSFQPVARPTIYTAHSPKPCWWLPAFLLFRTLTPPDKL
jgi:hypothetical protein